MSCLIVGRGRKVNELNMEIKPKFEKCTFLSPEKEEGPDIVSTFEDLDSKSGYDAIYFDMYVQEFLIFTGGGKKLFQGVEDPIFNSGKGVSYENNTKVRQSLLRNVKPGGVVYFPASKNVEDNIILQMNMARAFNEIAGKEFKVSRPKGEYPLFEHKDIKVPQAKFYYTLTKV
jgi:hypothetical protein